MGIFCSNLKIEKGKLGSMENLGDVLLCIRGENGIVQPKHSVLESCSAYRTIGELFRYEIGLPCRSDDDYDEDFEDYLDGMEDENICFVVLNNAIVLFCDSINGDVISAESIESVEEETRKLYEETKYDET